MSINTLIGARSHFSLGESMLTPAQIIQRAKAVGADAVTLTDTMTISGMVDFSSVAKKEGVKPIIGSRIRIVEDPLYRKPKKASGIAEKPNPEWFCNLFVKNEAGIKDLIKLLSKGHSSEYFYYAPRVSLDDVIETLSRGNVVFTTSDFNSVFQREDYMSVLERIKVATASTQSAFVEIVPINTPLFAKLNARALEAAFKLDIPPLVSYPALYELDEDAKTLEVMAAVSSNTKMDAPWRSQQFVDNFSVKGLRSMADSLKETFQFVTKHFGVDKDKAALMKASLVNLEVFSDLCGYEWVKQPVSLPVMAKDEFAELTSQIKAGWIERLTTDTMGYQPTKAELEVYLERLRYEIGVLKKMEFERYFLMVSDLVNWSKRNNILVGPGRGSAGGSLVAYLMGITDVDPIRFGLIFERFINPDRLDLPDVDLDFMSSRRGEVIDYLIDKYGEENVAGISNYGTMASASALRDVSRVHNLTNDQMSATRYVPKEHGSPVSLTDAAEMVPEIMNFRNEHKEIWDHAVKLEGKMRSMGRHAAGVVVAGEPIVNRAVVETRSDSRVVNWDKRVVEDWGLIKMDILGLSTLDTISKALTLIKERHGLSLILTKIPLNDEKVIEAFGNGETIGIFQFESGGMRKLLKNLAAKGDLRFEDIVAATALYRPGPMDAGLLDDYVAIKNDRKSPFYDHPNMRPALEETQSVIIYQEQVMQVARDLAGFSMTDADHLRKAMGKKDKDKMAEMRSKWVDGCVAHSSIDSMLAEVLFDKVEKFAGYGFNKSHSVEYSVISYWAMWLKVNYAAEFYAASLSVVGEDKLGEIVRDAQKHNIFVVPPDINKSDMDFVIGHDAKREQDILYTPFNRLKGLSDNTSMAILNARAALAESTSKLGAKRDHFESTAEFLTLVSKGKCNVRHRQILTDVGAFSSIEPSQQDARHPDRLKVQMGLMPGLVVDNIKADRNIEFGKEIELEVRRMMVEVRNCEGCSLASGVHPRVAVGKKPKFMVVTDSPNWSEEQKSQMFSGKASQQLQQAIKNAGVDKQNGYFTSLVKSPKEGKQLTTEQIGACSGFLKREIELLKPPVIVALGSAAIRYFVPDVKGGIMDLTGKVHYSAELDASIVFGINPLMISFDPDKQNDLDETFEKVAELLE